MKARLKIAIFGGTGCVGAPLSEWLALQGHEITVLSRDGSSRSLSGGIHLARWDPNAPTGEWLHEIRSVEAVVHLARSPLPSRWSWDARRAVKEERITLLRSILSSVRNMEPIPRVFVCASSHDIYGDRDGATPLDESAAEGTDFFGELYGEIEREARKLEAFGVRVVLARLGVVLGQGGNDPRTLPHVVASPCGALSWIHIADAVEMLERVLVDDSLSGPINMTAPQPTTAVKLRDSTAPPRQDRRTTLRTLLLSASTRPGTTPDASSPTPLDSDSAAGHVQSQSHWAYPAKLTQAGYRWRVTSIYDALERCESPTRDELTGSLPTFGMRRTVHETGDIPISWTEAGSGYPLIICSAAALPYEHWTTLLRFLSVRYRTFFLHPRGLWGGHLPDNPCHMSVADHARRFNIPRQPPQSQRVRNSWALHRSATDPCQPVVIAGAPPTSPPCPRGCLPGPH